MQSRCKAMTRESSTKAKRRHWLERHSRRFGAGRDEGKAKATNEAISLSCCCPSGRAVCSNALHPISMKINLEEYLDLLPKPALIQTITNDERVIYMNPVLKALCDVNVHASVTFDKLVAYPDRTTIAAWLHRAHAGSLSRSEALVTRSVKGPIGYEIKWSAVYIKHTALVLTGTIIKRTSTWQERDVISVADDTQDSKERTDMNDMNEQVDAWIDANKQANTKEQVNDISEHGISEHADPNEQLYEQALPLSSKASSSDHEEALNWKAIPRFADSLTGGGFMGETLRNYDWASSPLGPISLWPQSLLTAASLCMASSFPMAVWWGPEFVLIYNDGYSAVAGKKHPWLFGKGGSEGWSELWAELHPLAESVIKGNNCYSEDHLLFMTRNGFAEETYHTWSYIPIRKEDGSVGGLLNPSIESTGRVILERRLRTLRDLSTKTALAKNTSELCSFATEIMADNVRDIPFALIYTCIIEDDEEIAGTGVVKKKNNNIRLVLQDSVGISRSHPAAPEEIILGLTELEDENTSMWPFRQVLQEHRIIQIPHIGPGFEGSEKGWLQPVRSAVACPIAATDQEGVLGVLVMGVNQCRPIDDDYTTFMELLCRQIATGIAAVKSYETEVKRAEALAVIDRAKTAFFSSVSHELRTPLTLILGPIEDALEDTHLPLPDVHRSRMNLVYRNAKRLLRLVNSLLDFSRLEAGRALATYCETDLAKFTADLASVFRSAIEKGGVEYNVNCSEGGRPVWIDRDMWEKIVYNMIGNAFKFTMSGTIDVIVRPTPDQSAVVFSVADTGTGIPSHEISRVFERFHRVEGQTGRSHEGTGIGLALTYELVMMHGGKMEVKSEFGKGSVFMVTIPYGYSHLPQDRLDDGSYNIDAIVDRSTRSYGSAMVEEARRWLVNDDEDAERTDTASSTESSVPSNTIPMTSRGCHVLLADDNPDMRRYLKSLLTKWWQVTEVSDGRQALEAAMKNPPDLIVSDVMMPVLDGFGLLKVLRSQAETKFIPVILLSARAGDEARVDGLTVGADDYLVKPFSAKELVARVHTHLELGKLRAELDNRVKEQTHELAESEMRYKVLATLSPVGIFRSDPKGKILYTNDKWWEITGHDRKVDPTGSNFLTSIHRDDMERTTQIWTNCLTKAVPCNIEFRWKSTSEIERWCVAEMIVDYDKAMHVRGFVGALTDLTERKRLERERLEALAMAEQQQRRRAEEAETVKKQQELFIDMTCHELRNPLNGIYHNADILHESLERVQREVNGLQEVVMEDNKVKETKQKKVDIRVKKVMEWLGVEVEQDLEAVETINLCAKHQKKIADDVLHMSKISMDLLTLDKIDFRAQAEVSNVLRMFESEVKMKKIEVKLALADGFVNMKVDWVKADPTRLAQVLINLLTNAIRFTEKALDRRIIVTLDATDSVPPPPILPQNTDDPDCKWMQDEVSPPTSSSSSNTVHPSESTNPTGENDIVPVDLIDPNTIYLHVSISDSGVGMTPEEQTLLFRRFAQASPKTYAEFGGSGLGLFISKRLVEMQGGSIMVKSVRNEGTTFSFYVRCERGEPNPESLKKIALGAGKNGIKSLEKTKDLKEEQNSVIAVKEWEPLKNYGTSAQESETKKSFAKERTGILNVLIVEDNMVNQKVLRRQLEILGYTSTIANHGLEALNILEASAFSTSVPPSETLAVYDIILMDIEMPVMNGLEATASIREWEKSGRLIGRMPIIAVTGNARKEQLDTALEAGMDDYIVKPYQKKDLLEKLEKYSRRS